MSHRLVPGMVLWALILLPVSGCATQRPTEVVRDSGEQYLLKGNYQAAAVEFAEVAKRYPGDWRAQYELGKCYLELDRLADARRALEIAHSQRPKNPQIADALAEVLFQQGDENRLFVFLRKQAESTQSMEAYRRLAQYAMDTHDADTAKVAVETAIVIDNGQSTDPYLLAASFAERLGDLDLALRRLRQAYGIDPYDQTVKERLIALGEVPGPTIALPPGR